MKIFLLCLALFISVQALDHVDYPDLTTIKGKHKEAYVFFLCTRTDSKAIYQGNYEALRISIWRLKKLDPSRDIIVLTCQYVPNEQYYQLKEDGPIVIPVGSLKTGMKPAVKGWRDVNTKFLVWQLIGWERLLYLDIDIYFQDSFFDIWDQPANHIVEQPPAEFADKLDEKYHGVPLRDLFPYVLASCVDTGLGGHGDDDPNILNSGLFMLKPSIAHYNVLLNVANADVNSTLMMDQGVINYVYNRTGPIPWSNFSLIYDIFPYRPWLPKHEDGHFSGGLFSDDVKAYHYKYWDSGFAKWDGYREKYNQWIGYKNKMNAEYKAQQLLHPNDGLTGRVSVSFPSGGVVLSDKQAYSPSVTVYAVVVNQDLSKQPSEKQIKDGLDASNKRVLTLSQAGSPEGFNLKFTNLSPGNNYKIYYVKHNKESDKFSSVGAVDVGTATNFLEERVMASAPLISLSALSFILAIFIYL